MISHPDFPECTYGYVALRAAERDPQKFGRRIYSTPLHDLDEMRKRHATMANNEHVASPLLVARFELVTVEAWDIIHNNKEDSNVA